MLWWNGSRAWSRKHEDRVYTAVWPLGTRPFSGRKQSRRWVSQKATVKQRMEAASRRQSRSGTSRAIGRGHPFSFSLLLPFSCFQFALLVFTPSPVNCSLRSLVAFRTGERSICFLLVEARFLRNKQSRSIGRTPVKLEEVSKLLKRPCLPVRNLVPWDERYKLLYLILL